MSVQPIIRRFTTLTAAFPHGAYQSQDTNQPDLRAPSIKGQLRWWFHAIFHDKAAEDSLFGGLKVPGNGPKPGAQGSRVIVRVRPLAAPKLGKIEFMPHKGSRGGHKTAILPGASYEITLMPQRDGWSHSEHEQLARILDAWLLLGAIGQRANRGAGSLWSEQAPPDATSFMERARALLSGTQLRAAVLAPAFASEGDLRRVAGDFLADQAFQSCMTPFGSAFPRKPSLLRLRAARFGDALHLVALWDGRFQASRTLVEAVGKLAESKEIGRLLRDAIPALE